MLCCIVVADKGVGVCEGAHLTELAQLISTLGSQEVHINDVCVCVRV